MLDTFSKQPHSSHRAKQPLRNAEPSEVRGVREINRQFAVAGTENVLMKLRLVARENLDAFAPARDRHVPLLPVRGRLDGGIREQDVIHGFAL